jgi:hypothetical protein
MAIQSDRRAVVIGALRELPFLHPANDFDLGGF